MKRNKKFRQVPYKMLSFGVTSKKEKLLMERMNVLGIVEKDLLEKFIRSSGRGGQKVSKTSSCVYLKHIPTGLSVKVGKERSQSLNRFLARRALIEKYETDILKIKIKVDGKLQKAQKQKLRRKRRGNTETSDVEKMQWVVYILQCSDGSYYTGMSNDLNRRVQTHRLKKGAKYTRSRLPITLVFREKCETRSLALKRECEIKALARSQKIEVVKRYKEERCMSTLFTQIMDGDIPCIKIAEDDEFFAFLDIRPINVGHCLVITKESVDYIFDVDDDVLGRMMVFSKKIAKAMDAVLECKKIGVMVAGLEVPHCHIHLVPINSVGDLNFSKGKDIDYEASEKVAQSIKKILIK